MKILFRTFWISILLLGDVGCKNSTEHENTTIPVRPNIVLILADDQGWGDLSYNGNTNLSTPNIDDIAKNGVSFTNFYVQPVCSPTRAELLTGRHFSRMGVYSTSAGGERFNLGETTIADIFKEAGYRTAAYGKWHSGMQAPYHPNARGFDDFYGFASGHWGNYFDPMLEHNGEIVQGKGFIVDDLTDKGLQFISDNQNQPFFLYLPYNTPHSPMQVPEKYWTKFQDRELTMKHRDSTLELPDFTKAALAMVENIDYNVGRITDHLKNLQLEENTIIIFLSDNGPNSWRWNSGMRGRKGVVDEGGVRTPFFIKWKNKLPAARQIQEIASGIDLLPTLVSLTGISPTLNKPIDGVSLKPLLLDENVEWTDRFVFNHWNGKTSVRSQKYRLDNDNRLYDISADRAQLNDLSEKLPHIRDTLVTAKQRWLSEVDAYSAKDKKRSFPLGHPDFKWTQLPARDGKAHGNIQRSNKYPNDSYFTNWTSVDDFISWDIDVLAAGEFEVDLYYTCASENKGVRMQLSFKNSKISKEITQAHDPPETGRENDRVPRIESYVKDFKSVSMGTIQLQEGPGALRLTAQELTGEKAIEVRLLQFKRIN
ncbi:arylsulfatase [Muriicola sp. Z0-33]|uniref:arylsulfatase n=1 Tax=Muriicola sp. Z0-33 TaxID=2816957 RepID=UPI002238003B|nr:arylsulfatase [Muriicola sp. Z0-33]